jgi:hypothetical protein
MSRKTVSISEDALVPNHRVMQAWRYTLPATVLEMNCELYSSAALPPEKETDHLNHRTMQFEMI